MDRFLKRKSSTELQPSSSISKKDCLDQAQSTSSPSYIVNLAELPADPGFRIQISSYHPNEQDKVRRAYLQKGPCQPRIHNYPQTILGKELRRRFNPAWFKEFGSWLEYSISKDAAYCLCCYLFRNDIGNQGGGDSFVVDGFKNWKKKESFLKHVGGPNSAHNKAIKACKNLMNQKKHIESFFSKQSDRSRKEYRLRLNASVDCIRFLLRQGMAFRGHDESNDSSNQGNFLELLQFLADHNDLMTSCKRRDILRQKQIEKVTEALRCGELLTGQGLNQEISIKRASDTRWGSHYGTLISLIVMFSSVIDVLEIVTEDGSSSEQRGDACALLEAIQSFDFIFNLHLMKKILGITDELSKALQRKEQDIVNAMDLVMISKQRLQRLRDDEWNSLLDEISSFCFKQSIIVPNMEDDFVARGRSRRRADEKTNLHHYRVELFYTTIDMQLQELNHRFNEVNTELLLCMECLSPRDLFHAFNKQKLLRLAQFYPSDFSEIDLMTLDNQLETYIIDMRFNCKFSELKGISGLAEKMVEMRKNILYPLVYLRITLALTLPVATATATVERAFSAMKIVKNRLRSTMGDEWMNDLLVIYIEKDIFDNIDNEMIMQRFQNMKTRRGQL